MPFVAKARLAELEQKERWLDRESQMSRGVNRVLRRVDEHLDIASCTTAFTEDGLIVELALEFMVPTKKSPLRHFTGPIQRQVIPLEYFAKHSDSWRDAITDRARWEDTPEGRKLVGAPRFSEATS